MLIPGIIMLKNYTRKLALESMQYLMKYLFKSSHIFLSAKIDISL